MNYASMPVWVSGAIRGAKPVVLPVGAAALGLTAGYQLAFRSSNKGDWQHPTDWGLGAVKGVMLAGVPAIALAVGGPVLARRAGLAVAQDARQAAALMSVSNTLTKAQVVEQSRAAFEGIESAAAKSAKMGELALPVGIVGVGGVIGTGWALDVTQGRLDKPDLHVIVDQNITTRGETTTSRAGRELTDAGGAAQGIVGSVGNALGGIGNTVGGWFSN